MNFYSFKKTGFGAIILFLIFFLIFSPLGDVVPKANAITFGEAMGKAVAAGAACYAAVYVENLVLDLVIEKEAVADGYASLLEFPLVVPVVDQTVGKVSLRDQSGDSLGQSKDCIRDVVAKIIGDWIVDQIVIWIQGGGKPRFVTDWKKFMSDAVNAGVGEAVSQTNAAFLCSPFKLQVQLSLLPVRRFQQRLECTLDDIVKNINNFFGDFRNGNWIAYRQLWYPQNNYYGTLIMVHDEAAARALAEKNAAEEEAVAGQGFIGVRKCKLVVNAENPEGYEKCAIVTPGYAVGETVAEAITTDIRWAENIKSWTSAVVNALVNAAFQKVIKKGLASGDYQYSYSDSKSTYNAGTLPTVKNIPENYGITYEDIQNCNALGGAERDSCYENLKKERCDNLENEQDKNDCRALLDQFLQNAKNADEGKTKTPSEVPSGGGGGGGGCHAGGAWCFATEEDCVNNRNENSYDVNPDCHFGTDWKSAEDAGYGTNNQCSEDGSWWLAYHCGGSGGGGGGGGETCSVVSSSEGGQCSNGNTELIRTYSCPSLSKCQERENKWSSEGNTITESCAESGNEYLLSAIFCT